MWSAVPGGPAVAPGERGCTGPCAVLSGVGAAGCGSPSCEGLQRVIAAVIWVVQGQVAAGRSRPRRPPRAAAHRCRWTAAARRGAVVPCGRSPASPPARRTGPAARSAPRRRPRPDLAGRVVGGFPEPVREPQDGLLPVLGGHAHAVVLPTGRAASHFRKSWVPPPESVRISTRRSLPCPGGMGSAGWPRRAYCDKDAQAATRHRCPGCAKHGFGADYQASTGLKVD